MTVYMLMYSIPEEAGGITSVMLHRSRLLQENGIESKILTLDDKNYNNLKVKLKDTNRLSEGVDIINLHEELRKEFDINDETLKEKNVKKFDRLNELNDEELYVEKKKYFEKGYARYYDKNHYLMYKKWVDGILSHIDYFEKNKRTHRHIFINKVLRKKQTFNDYNGLLEEAYLANDGFCYLSIWFDSNKNVRQIFVFNRESNGVKRFSNNKEFHSEWLDKLLCENDTLILDGVGSYHKVANMKNKQVNKIFTIHTNHYESPYKPGSKIKPEIKKLLDDLSKLNLLVVLTEEQKKDIVEEFGDYNNIIVIPNAVNVLNDSEVVKNKKENSITILQRYVQMKNINHIIKAIKKVKKKIPDVNLNIYGTGPEKENYKKLVTQLNLENNVNINDYAFNSNEELGKASLSVLTSEYEGLSMSAIESMNVGTPVIAYPIKYGVADVITNEKDGIITDKKNDINELSEKITYLLKDNEKRHEFSVNSRKKIKTNFSYEAVLKKWREVIK